MIKKVILFLSFIILTGCATNITYWHDTYRDFSAYTDQTWIEENGKIYGAKPDNSGPIGGGSGYKNIITKGDFNVKTIDELLKALTEAREGDVIFIPGNVKLDFTSLIYTERLSIKIPDGVTLAGDRGYNGSPGALLRSLAFNTEALIEVEGSNARVTGLRIEGPDKERHMDHHARSFNEIGSGHSYYYLFPTARGIRVLNDSVKIDNCELWGWSHAAIFLKSGKNHRINNNYIHHNQRHGLGYGVSHDKSVSIIEYNLFNFNRHSIAGTGAPGSSYSARHNVELEYSLSHCFDMHGGRDREDGTDIAGKSIVIENNTFFPSKRAIAIRGIPQNSAIITGNIFFQKKLDSDVIRDWPLPDNVRVFDNKYDSRNLLGKTIDE